MKTFTNVLAFSACMLLMAAPWAMADDVSDELAEMRAQVEQLQGQVAAQAEQIEYQGEVIQQARLEQAQQSDSRFGASGITAFLQRLEVSGHVAGSYFWNFNDPGPVTAIGGPGFWGALGGGNTGQSGNIYPFHGNHNSFQVDQVWLGIEHPVDEENRAGFRFDLVFGTTACWLGNSVPTRCGMPGIIPLFPVAAIAEDNTSQYYVSQAYVQYLAPITENGILIKAGKWATIVGAETAEATANFNITRGNVYAMLQPRDHVGVLASTELGDSGFSVSAGVMNDDENGFFGLNVPIPGFPTLSGSADPDRNDAKSLAFQLAWANDTVSVANSILWGPSHLYSDRNASGLYDLVVTWDPTEDLSTWLNFDYRWDKALGPTLHSWGVATAARYALTERLGISGRFEYVEDDGGFASWLNLALPPFSVLLPPQETSIYSLTATVDYALTNNLTLRGEVRYDDVNKRGTGSDAEFFDKGGDYNNDQTTAGVEIVYEF